MIRVLVVDDDTDIREFVRDSLEVEEIEISGVENYTQAVDALRKQAADVVITDIFMPEKDGFELIETLRSDFPSTKIIAMTGGGIMRAKDITVKLISEVEVDGCLKKPFSIDELVAMVKKILS